MTNRDLSDGHLTQSQHLENGTKCCKLSTRLSLQRHRKLLNLEPRKWRRKGYSVGGAKLVKGTASKVRSKIIKTTPIISGGKIAFGRALFSKMKQKAAGDLDRGDPVGS